MRDHAAGADVHDPQTPAAGPTSSDEAPASLVRKTALIADALATARDELERAREEIRRLTEAPLTYGAHLAVADLSTRAIDVTVAGRRMRVRASERIALGGLEPGTALLLDEHFNAVDVAGADDVGELVHVEQVLDAEHVVVTVRSEDTRVLRLGPALRRATLRTGDSLMADLKSGFAHALVPRPEIEDLLLDRAPSTPWQAIGGLDETLAVIRDAIELPMTHPQLYSEYRLRPPRGLLLYGPPGVGKTLIARAVATALAEATGRGTHFLSIKGPQLLDKYVGETERRIRMIFSRARDKAAQGVPVVIFFDEMESLFRTRGTGVSSDVETTVVPQLLAEIDGVEEMRNVVVIGASNREDMIDPAILRPGRLDVHVRIDRPDRAACASILARYLTAELPLHPQEVEAAGSPEQAVAAMSEAVLDALFARDEATAVLNVHRRSGAVETWHLADLVSGAMVASVVERAKSAALKDAVHAGQADDRGRHGLRTGHLLDAVRAEVADAADLPGTSDPEEWTRVVGRSRRNDPVVALVPVRHEEGS